MRKYIQFGAAFRYEPEPYPLTHVKDFGYTMDIGGLFTDWTLNPAAVVESLRIGTHTAELITNPQGCPSEMGILSQKVKNDREYIIWTIEKNGFEEQDNTIELVYDVENYEHRAMEMLVAVLTGCNWGRYRYTPFEFVHLSHSEFGSAIARMLEERKELMESWNTWARQYNLVMKSAVADKCEDMMLKYRDCNLMEAALRNMEVKENDQN